MAKRRRERGLFAQPITEAGDRELVGIVKPALRLARRRLADHPHKHAPEKSARPRLFACVILKAHMGCTYRKAEELLILMPAAREAIGLEQAPRFTTGQAFADRPDILALIDRVRASIGRAVNKAHPQDATIDATGLEVTSTLAHCVSRAGREYVRCATARLGVLCTSLIPVAPMVDQVSSHDMRQAWALHDKLKATCRPAMF